MTKNPSNEKTRMLRFAIVGAIGTIVDFGIFNLLINLTELDPVLCSAISFGFAVINNFILNRIWTFPDARKKNIWTQLIQFALVSIFGLIIRTPIFSISEKLYAALAGKWMPNFLIPPAKLGYNLALATAIVIVMIWNFFINRIWTFNDAN